MIKFLFNNKLFFPDLTPPKGIRLNDIINLILGNAFRILITIIVIFGILSIEMFIFFSIYESPKYTETITYTFYFFYIFPIIYLLSSIIYTIIKSWKWYIRYYNSKGKGKYKTIYENKIAELNQELRNDLINNKLDNNKDFNIEIIYETKETNIFYSLRDEYVEEYLRKNRNVNTKNIEHEISFLKNEYNDIIERIKKSKF